MHKAPFAKMPSLSEWKHKSSVGNMFKPRRAADRVLTAIDSLVAAMSARVGVPYLLAELFYVTKFWNNNHMRDPKMDDRRRGPVMQLNMYALNRLASIHRVGPGGLHAVLTRIYGTGLDQVGGVEKDARSSNQGRYLSVSQREQYRVIFKSGLAYGYDCLHSAPADLARPVEPIHTQMYAKSVPSMDDRTDTGAGYVLSMSREFYIAPFCRIGGDDPNVKSKYVTFHSNFMAGKPVQTAGMIEIKKGVVTNIDNLSGHYKPVDKALSLAVSHLQLAGMDLKKITVNTLGSSSDGAIAARADKFLAVNGNWAAIRSSGVKPKIPSRQGYRPR